MSTSDDIIRITETISARLPHVVREERLHHIAGVTATAADLAGRFRVDVARVRLAATAHDMDRDRSPGELFALAADWRIPLSRFERELPKLLHGPVSAARLHREFDLDDRDLIDAVRHHTLGHPVFADQSEPLGLILYIADFCEPGRRVPDDRTRTSILALGDLHDMVKRIIAVSRHLFGPLEEPTEHLYARLSGDTLNGT